ncbi:MAG: endonuclease [Flavobacteriales bacterium]|nr:endonuclease [Flavobacteriales bacterium]
MRTGLLFTLLLSLPSYGQPPAGYYDAAEGLSGDALREVLNGIISPHTVLANSALWAAFETTDRKADGGVWDMYSDVPGGTPPYVFQFVTDQCGTYTGEGDCFNREHSFPQSWYGSAPPMSTDLFHLYPVDAWVNQQRGNLAYGTVGTANWTSANGGKRGPCNWPGCSETVFEPIDAYKGDLARSFLYMQTRYLQQVSLWSSPMMSGGEFLPWAEDLLLAWHEQDPVSEKEVARNNAVFELQGNRNPYIDRPEWVASIWGPFAAITENSSISGSIWYSDAILYLRFELPEERPELLIQDATGKIVRQYPTLNASASVELDDLANGVYLATVRTSYGVRSVRFVR